VEIESQDGWAFLKQYTGARIAMGRAGTSIRTKDLLDFQLAHALAKDAVYEELDIAKLELDLRPMFSSVQTLQSKVSSKTEYLQRPDFGRVLSSNSAQRWKSFNQGKRFDVQLIVADGPSATAIHRNAFRFLDVFLSKLPQHFTIAPLALVEYGRVAISDSIGEGSNASLSIILIGERPGLSAPDSMGIYMTYGPKTGNTDESRNCISNVRTHGLSYQLAADKLIFLATEAIRLKISGVNLKESGLGLKE